MKIIVDNQARQGIKLVVVTITKVKTDNIIRVKIITNIHGKKNRNYSVLIKRGTGINKAHKLKNKRDSGIISKQEEINNKTLNKITIEIRAMLITEIKILCGKVVMLIVKLIIKLKVMKKIVWLRVEGGEEEEAEEEVEKLEEIKVANLKMIMMKTEIKMEV